MFNIRSILFSNVCIHFFVFVLTAEDKPITFIDDDILAHQHSNKNVELCKNPNGRLGVCISIFDCNPILSLVEMRIPKTDEFIRKCQCRSTFNTGKTPFVCCTKDTYLITEPPKNQISSTDNNILDNNNKFPKKCGNNIHTLKPRIYGGTATEPGEYSWMVVLEYRTAKGNILLDCSGSLIHERYVLTAAHCVKDVIVQKIGKLVSVRIGEHNTDTEIDCNRLGCLPPYQRFYVEKIIVHENYGSNKALRTHEHNDIALIRLDKNVQFDQFIQPICLPNIQDAEELTKGTELIVAGWGHTSLANRSSTKLKVDLQLFDQELCRNIHANRFDLTPEQLCAGGSFYKDSCSGDSGGPLMRLSTKLNWVLEGIVSYGYKCGLENIPGVYTRVRSYIDWIKQNVEA